MTEPSLNLQKIISHIAGFDLLGKSSADIDTQKEYNLLGQYLNGSYKIEGADIKDLKKKEKRNLNGILNQLYQQWGEVSKKPVEENVVNRENVLEYLNKYNALFYKQNTSETDIQTMNKIREKIECYMKKAGIPEPYEDISFKLKDYLPKIDFVEKTENDSKGILEFINNPISKEILERSVNDFLSNNELSIPTSNQGVDLGDGDFNEVVFQKSDVCWGLGGINSLAQSEIGLSLLENNKFRDEKTGVYAIHLKEAADSNLPSKGIYIITPQEIADASQTVAEGEGDSVAYLLAIDKYFNELKTHQPELAETRYVNDIKDGNLSCRFYEVITGGTAANASCLGHEDKIPKGITLGNRLDYNQIAEIVASGKGAAVLSLYPIEGDVGHAISVVGVENGKLVIQESYNDPEVLKPYKDQRNRPIFRETTPINDAPAYTITEENFLDWTTTRTVFRWE